MSVALQVSFLWGVGIYLLYNILETHKTKRLFHEVEQEMQTKMLHVLGVVSEAPSVGAGTGVGVSAPPSDPPTQTLTETERVEVLASHPQGNPLPQITNTNAPYNRLGVDVKYNTQPTNSVSPYDALFDGHSLQTLASAPVHYNPHHHFSTFQVPQDQAPQPSNAPVQDQNATPQPQRQAYTVDNWHIKSV